MLKIQNLSLSFSDKKLFENLSFEIKKGEHVCVSGISGRGKSSVLKLIQGFLVPNQGEIVLNTIELSDSTIQEIRQQIIWIPQNVSLSVNSGMELVRLLELENELSKIESYLVQLGLEKQIIGQSFSEISGGQKQRVVIAICFSLNRDVILMDEPTSSLDDESSNKLMALINSMTDKVILSASHNPLWLQNAHRVINL